MLLLVLGEREVLVWPVGVASESGRDVVRVGVVLLRYQEALMVLFVLSLDRAERYILSLELGEQRGLSG